MAHGKPDYMQVETQSAVVDTMDVSGIVYQHGFTRLDGGGRLVWLDDFRAGINRHFCSVSNGGLLPYATTEMRHMFGYSPSIVLDPVVDTGVSRMELYNTIMLSGKIGIEVGIYLPSNHGTFNISFAFFLASNITKQATVAISSVDNGVSITDTGGSRLVWSPTSSTSIQDINFAIKLVIDPAIQKYDSLYLFGTKVNLSSYSLPNVTYKEKGVCYYAVRAIGAGAVKVEPCYVNYVAVSADEP